MTTNDIDWDEEFADDPDYQAMSPEQRKKLLSIMEKMIDMGMAAVYGDEEDDVPEAKVHCDQCIPDCQARCCSLIFALTKDEVKAGMVQYNKTRPYFIAHEDDGYCAHHIRHSYHCSIWENRPLRCRRYDCRDDKNIWPNGVPDEFRSAFQCL